MDNGKLGYKVENPFIQVLLRHLTVEAEIFRTKKDLYSLNWVLLGLSDANKEIKDLFQYSIKSLEEESEKINNDDYELTTQLVIKFALAERILKNLGKQNAKITRAMNFLIKKAEDKNWFHSQETISLLLFLLGNNYSNELQKAYDWLHSKYNQFKDSRNYPNLIDSALGLMSYNQNNVSFPVEEILDQIEQQSIERIAKFLILLKLEKEDNDTLRYTISILEGRLNNKFEKWIFPNLEMVLFEGINIMNSNLTTDNQKEIISNLQKNKVEWAKSLEITDKGLLLTNLEATKQIPNFNVKEDSIALLALSMAGRKSIYQLDEGEYETASKAIKQSKQGYTGIKEKHVKYYFYFSCLLLALFIFVTAYSIGLIPGLIFDLVEEFSVIILIKSVGYGVIFFYLMIFYYRIGDKLISKGEINKSDILASIFGFDRLISLIRGINNDV
ncbi:MAG: hypothetical protein NTW30_05785 [Candidatus Aenigmarchaeota archaeon]|nr:hypothetical protein [Candidatus Aenigmarchaeota archaeon]